MTKVARLPTRSSTWELPYRPDKTDGSSLRLNEWYCDCALPTTPVYFTFPAHIVFTPTPIELLLE